MLVAAALILVGCGGASRSSSSSSAHRSTTSRSRTTARRHQPPQRSTPSDPGSPAPPDAGRPADAQTVAVIRRWADALRRGDVRAAAALFQFPSFFAPGPDQEVTIHNLREAEAANATLPCGAKLISVVRVGGALVQALFRLTGRPGRGGSSCDPGAGQTARTNFVIRAGHIHVWLRAPDAPGDNPSPPPSTGSGGSGSLI